MCLDYAARVVTHDADSAIVDREGRRSRVSTLLVPDVRVGDWVRVAVGTILERLDPALAQQINDEVRIAQGVGS